MPRFELLFPSRFVKGVDFCTGPRVVTIKALVSEEIETNLGKNKKTMLYLEEILDKALILNITNARTIASMHGNETDDWVGKQITLVMSSCSSKGGETVDCVRVAKGIPTQKAGKK